MNILWKRSVSKKGAALMSVMCMMTFIIILGTVALTVTEAAHKNVVYQNKVQQAYYTAKSAAETTAAYISSNPANKNAADGTLEKELYDIHAAYKADVDAGHTVSWTAGVNYIAGIENTSTLGSYTVDIYPTVNPNVFKLNAKSNYLGIEGSTAILVGPSTGGSGLNDAIVSTGGGSKLGGSPHWEGSASFDEPGILDFGGTSGFIGGSVCNTGSIALTAENGMHQDYFNKYVTDGGVLRLVAGKELSFYGTTACTYDDTRYANPKDANISVWNYFSFFVSGGNMTLDKCPEEGSKLIKPGYYAKSAQKGLLCGGNLISGGNDFKFCDYYMPFYVKGEMRIDKKDGSNYLNIHGNVYVKGNITTSMNINIDGDLYCGGNINENAGARVTVNGNRVLNMGSGFEAAASDMEQLYQEQLNYSKNATLYGDWNFTEEQKALMGVNGESVKIWKPTAYKNAEKYGTNALTFYKHEIISDSGKFDPSLFNSCNTGGNGEGGIVFDTNIYTTEPTYDADGKMIDPGIKSGEYKDIYIMLISNVNLQNKPCIEIWGRGNVYFYLPDGVKFKANELAIYSRDFIDEAHFWFISNQATDTSNPNDDNAYIVNLGSLNATQVRGSVPRQFVRKNNNGGNCSCYCYIYCPNGGAKVSGSSGISGSMIAKLPSVDSGSNTSDMFVQPVDSKGNPIGMNGVGATVSYSILLRSRSFN